jgi:hypothetical protein
MGRPERSTLSYFGAIMKYHKAILTTLLISLLLTGWVSKSISSDKVISQINVYGAELFSNVDYREINGVVATEEPCLKGYDRRFDALDITIGYGFDKKIRKIITRNPNTSLFGISPGMSFEEGKQKVLQGGFVTSESPFLFKAERYSLTLLVDSNQNIFGVKVELLD